MTYPDVLEVLNESPLTYRQISAKTGLKRRDVESEIQRLRLAGHPVITDGDGARIAKDPVLIRACAKRLRKRALNQLTTAAALDKAADALPLTLFGAA